MQGVIRVGVAGWDYPDWSGVVYPVGVSRGFDRLAYLARFVDVVEINSTFYRPVEPGRAASWLRRIGPLPGFRFTAKAHRDWTHETGTDPSSAISLTLRGLAPLREAGRLGAVLVQFPQSFHRDAAGLERLERILGLSQGWPLVIEVRHSSWDHEEAVAWLRERGAGWCVADQPLVGRSTARARPRAASRVAYLRLHGRNAANWFRKDAGRDARYDYLYSEPELVPLADAARKLARQAEEVFVVQNNHFRGKALVNALQMRHLLGHASSPAPPSLIASYPELERIAHREDGPQKTLF